MFGFGRRRDKDDVLSNVGCENIMATVRVCVPAGVEVRLEMLEFDMKGRFLGYGKAVNCFSRDIGNNLQEYILEVYKRNANPAGIKNIPFRDDPNEMTYMQFGVRVIGKTPFLTLCFQREGNNITEHRLEERGYKQLKRGGCYITFGGLYRRMKYDTARENFVCYWATATPFEVGLKENNKLLIKGDAYGGLDAIPGVTY